MTYVYNETTGFGTIIPQEQSSKPCFSRLLFWFSSRGIVADRPTWSASSILLCLSQPLSFVWKSSQHLHQETLPSDPATWPASTPCPSPASPALYWLRYVSHGRHCWFLFWKSSMSGHSTLSLPTKTTKESCVFERVTIFWWESENEWKMSSRHASDRNQKTSEKPVLELIFLC